MLAAVLCACALAPATAQAGTYDVYSCKFGSSFYGNNAWTASIATAGGNAALFTADTTCSGPGDVLVAALQPSVQYAPASWAALALTAPPSTRITDYTVTLRQLYAAAGLNMDPNTPFVMTTFGPYAFTLAGNYDAGVIAYVTATSTTGGPRARSTRPSRCQRPTRPTAPSSRARPRRWRFTPAAGRAGLPSAASGASDLAQTQLIGSKVTIEDNRAPGDVGRPGRARAFWLPACGRGTRR